MKAYVLAAMATLSMSGAADAAVLTMTFRGVADSGGDYTGVFGAPRSFAGRAIEVAYTYDAAAGQLLTPPGEERLNGGSENGQVPVLRSVLVTIAGVGSRALKTGYDEKLNTLAGTPATYGRVQGYSDYQTYIPNPYGAGEALVTRETASVYLFDRNMRASLLTPGDYALTDGMGYGYIDVSTTDYAPTGATFSERFEIFMKPTSVAIAPAVQGVPEPASWALMIGGFGLAGVAARRRTPRAVAA